MASPAFFESAEGFRHWLEENHTGATELLVGFHKAKSGLPSMAYQEALDEALCFGWIDGVRKSLGETSYTIRFTPRRKGSSWSKVNIARVGQLLELGSMHPSGIAEFEKRSPTSYSYEVQSLELAPEYEDEFRRNRAAWNFFIAQAQWYQRWAKYHVMSAKREETQRRRLQQIIGASEMSKRL